VTIGLIALGVTLLATGAATQERLILVLSMLLTALAAVPLIRFGLSVSRTSGHRIRRESGPAPAAAGLAPTYDELDIDIILPVLPQLERAELTVLRDHEAGHRARRAILSKIDQLLAGGEDSTVPEG
jgi:hypothetical protein